jgi:DNA-binding CsgD family transcriptional regulator
MLSGAGGLEMGVRGLAVNPSLSPDRAAVERTARELILDVTRRRTPTGVSIVLEGAPGIGKTFLSQAILDAIPPGQARVRNMSASGDPAEAAFGRIDELCADRPVVLCADDAHDLDAATLTLIRRLVWASRSLPLAVLVTTRPYPADESLAVLIGQAKVRLWLPPMGPMMVERLVHDRTGRWAGPLLRRILGLAAGNPLFAAELLRAYQNAGALAEAEPDLIEARFELDLRATGLDEVIRGQLRQLDQPTRDVLAAIAVWGTDIGARDLTRLLSGPDGAVYEAVERAIASGLVGRDLAGTVAFSHQLFREVTYGETVEAERCGMHRRAAEMLAADGYRPSLVADHLLQAAGTGSVPVWVDSPHGAAAAARAHLAQAATGLPDDVPAIAPDVPERLLVDHVGSLMNRADTTAALEVLEATAAIAGLPASTVRQLEGTRAWLLMLAGQPLHAAELDAMMARFVAAGDRDAQANLLATVVFTAFQPDRPQKAVELARTRVAIGRARRLAAERQAHWLDPFLGFAAGAIAFATGDWDDAVAELDSALALAERTGTSWLSMPVGVRSYIDAHRGDSRAARVRLESFRHRGLPLMFGRDRPGWAELAVLEAEGAIREAVTLARTLWAGVRSHPDRWAADLAPDVARVALAGMDRHLARQIGDDVPALCPPDVAQLIGGMLAADCDAIEGAATRLARAGRLKTEAFAREELACAAAAVGDRDRALLALDAALAGYRRMGAVPDRDRALGRMRALGIRRSSREAHRDASLGWASLTQTETRIAALVREGLTNREIGTRLFVSPRTIQTHVSHILQKTGLRSRVEIARFGDT